jgi:hypothetical protein
LAALFPLPTNPRAKAMRRFKAILLIAVLLAVMPLLGGCASYENNVAARGGIFGSYKGSYVVVNYAGNSIADVWVLKNAYVQSEEKSDGWRFMDETGSMVFLGGDVKVIRCKSDSELAKWNEYHAEFETKTYQQKFAGK